MDLSFDKIHSVQQNIKIVNGFLSLICFWRAIDVLNPYLGLNFRRRSYNYFRLFVISALNL